MTGLCSLCHDRAWPGYPRLYWRPQGKWWVRRQMLRHQRTDPFGKLVGGIVAAARQDLEPIRASMVAPVPCAAAEPTVSSLSPQIYRVGTFVGPTGACRTPQARYPARAASFAAGLPMTDRWRSIASAGTPFAVNRVRSHFASSAKLSGPACGSRNRVWWPKRRFCSPSGIASDTPTCGAGEDGQGCKLIRRFIGDLPGEAVAMRESGQVDD